MGSAESLATCYGWAGINAQLLLVIRRIHLRELLPLVRQFIKGEDRRHRANRNARAAVDALDWINVELRGFRKCGFIFFRMDAVNRARIHTRGIFRPNAGLCNNVCHSLPFVRSGNERPE